MSLVNLVQAQANSRSTAFNQQQTAATKFVELKGTRYAYRVLGSAPGIPLVLLQHFTGTMDDWDPAITNGLAPHYTVILFDNKGVGGSGGQTPNSIEEMATDATDFIKSLGYSKVNLLGFSMGGFIAQQIVLVQPQLVNKLILAGTQHKGGAGLDSIVGPLTRSGSLTPVEQKIYLFFSQTAQGHQAGAASQARIHERAADRDPAATNESITAQLNAILDWAKPVPDAVERMKAIHQPVLIVNGNNDIVVPTVNSHVMFENIPNAYLYLYPDAGHGSIFQYAGLFVQQTVAFLRG
jgi:pimeloyl-ACP methyl ester carboxylesterase